MSGPESAGDLERVTADDPPPLLGAWPRVYLFILCYLALLIVGFYIFARAFAP